MAKQLKFVTLNIRGLGGKQKSKVVLDYLRTNSKGITFLQETHSSVALAEKWMDYWKGKLYVAHGDTNSKGVAILFHPKLTHEILDKHEDLSGRYLILRVKVNDEILILANCYLPTKDHEREQCVVLEEIIGILNNYSDEKIILGGDFNVALNPKLERLGGRIDPNESKKFRVELKAMLISLDLEDIFRNNFPEDKIFTWHNKTKGISTRLDYWFISDKLLNRINKCEVNPGLFTDHDLVQFLLQSKEPSEQRGPGYWKFNVSFLSNSDYVSKVKNIIPTSFDAVKNYADKGLVWDFIKMQIRKISIEFSKKYSMDQRYLENNINAQLKTLQQEYNNAGGIERLEEMNQLKKQLEGFHTMKTNGAIIRSKIKNIEMGERNTAYFLSLEKKNNEVKSITHLRQPDNSVISGKDEISKALSTFYESLYSEIDVDKEFDDSEFVPSENIKLLDVDKNLCEGVITEVECLNALKKLKNGKTPGVDGLPADFYKFFWSDIKIHVVASINYALEKNELSLDQRRGLISLVPKKDKDRLLLKNWRPIALLTTDYKLIAKCLASRIIKVIDKLISNDQTGYIKGRYIGENIRTVQDMISYLKLKNKSGILLLIDFEKAFDTVRWKFIEKTLTRFNFGNSFIKWVQILYNNIQSAVLNNGHLTPFFSPHRGVRQGCPLSVYLFILVAEVLAIRIRADKSIEGIKVSKSEVKISQLADDTSVFISNPKSIGPVFKTLNNFRLCSGLKANIDKTKLYNIGATFFPKEEMGGYTFEKDDIVLLGITITTDEKKSVEKNFSPRVRAIKNILKQWSRRKLSLKGKITVINALVVSLIVYPASVLITPINVLEEINRLLYTFLWDGKRPKIAAKILENKVKLGGLKMPNIFLKVKAWQLAWLQRAVRSPNNNWVIIVNELLQKLTLPQFVHCDLEANHPFMISLPTFYKEILTTWFQLKRKHFDSTDITTRSIWFNKNITVEGNPLFWNNWYEKGIFFVDDILQEEGEFSTVDQLRQKYGLTTNFLTLLQIRQSIPFEWRQTLRNYNINQNMLPPTGPLIINILNNIPFIRHKTFRFYEMLIELKRMRGAERHPKCTSKWAESFDIDVSEWEQIFSRPFVACRSTVLQSFQYRLLHRVITCNHWLFNAKIKDSPNCDTCNVDDTLQHFFLECQTVQNFWLSLNTWCSAVTQDNTFMLISKKENLFGFDQRKKHAININFILCLANKYIHDNKLNGNLNISFPPFLEMFKHQLNYEKQICIKNNELTMFESKWALFLAI